jgi:hypothetical protein
MSEAPPAISFPRNVVNSTSGPLKAHGETVFLGRLFAMLQIEMGEAFDQFTFVVHRRIFGEFAGKPINLNQGDDKCILIVIADEREVFPCEEFLSYRHVFRAYGNTPENREQIHAFPVGYLNAAGLAEYIPFESRHTNVFFSGYLNRNRVDLLKQFRRIPWLPSRNLPKSKYVREIARRAVEKLIPERTFADWVPGARLDFTEWFAKGLAPEEYARVLANSRIALCPPGFESHETIRHWEAMRLGCVVISAPLPPNRFYRNSPIIELDDWSELKLTVTRLLANPEELHELHQRTLEWWTTRCSESAVAKYMAQIIMLR